MMSAIQPTPAVALKAASVQFQNSFQEEKNTRTERVRKEMCRQYGD
jgi:hypothetical protein